MTSATLKAVVFSFFKTLKQRVRILSKLGVVWIGNYASFENGVKVV